MAERKQRANVAQRKVPQFELNLPNAPDNEGMIRIGDRPFLMLPFEGGAITARDPAQLPIGSFSMVQNLRPTRPGFKRRLGQRVQHSTADGSNRVETLHQFCKGKRTERHFFGQMSDGDILEATNMPPATTTGVFGSEVYSGTASGSGQIPASWSQVKDLLLYSNGKEQHQLYAGDDNYVESFVIYKGSGAPPSVPEDGEDYSIEVSDGLTGTEAILDALDTYASNECAFIYSPVPITTGINWVIETANSNTATSELYYKKSDNTWASCSITDGTLSGGKTLAVDGSMTWSAPSDEIPWYMYGRSGFWYQLRVSATLSATVRVSSVTYGAGFQDIRNVWDGILEYAVEAHFFDNSESTYKLYGPDNIVISDMVHSAADTEDRLYFNSPVPLMGVYVEVGDKPNTETTTTIGGVKTHTGTSTWASVGTVTDGTNGFVNSGWITWPQKANEPTQFQTSRYYSYWYYIHIATATVSSDVRISIQTMPYFDIEELGRGVCNGVWKNRALYSFDRYPNYIYVSAKGKPMCLNGPDYGILEAGDGRQNEIRSMVNFDNDLLVGQEQIGKQGGCMTIFEGYSPTTYGRLVISTIIGPMNWKCMVVVEGVLVSTVTEQKVKTLCFVLCRQGFVATDGRIFSVVSDDIGNYFDPTKSECITRATEDRMFIHWSTTESLIYMGIVSATGNTENNIFPIFDLVNKQFYFDDRAQELSCMTEIEAGSGDVAIVTMGGGVDDGFVYQLNYGRPDVSSVIDAYVMSEFNYGGLKMLMREVLLLCKVHASGNVAMTPYAQEVAKTGWNFAQTAAVASETSRRNRKGINLVGHHLSLRFRNTEAATDDEMDLYSYGVKLFAEITQ